MHSCPLGTQYTTPALPNRKSHNKSYTWTPNTKVIVEENGKDINFNSPNDIAVAPDHAIWFTDPTYGSIQGFRPNPPKAPNSIYRIDPETKEVKRVVDLGGDKDGKGCKPNGLCFSGDGKTLYFTDTMLDDRSIYGIPLNKKGDDVAPGAEPEHVVRVLPADPESDNAIPDGLKWVDGLLVTSCGPNLAFIDPVKKQRLGDFELGDHFESVTNFALSADGDLLAVVGGGTVAILGRKYDKPRLPAFPKAEVDMRPARN
uniref:SMP-30/Gluconolactonase/LRE-like region domain-containing protein n=1 Tax=Lotharella globosa TaxID=91324 RepID=A0A7S3Z3R8_9EUKA